ncbi:hypothetical protein Lal_00018423 [Lupinus albus]|nr:hypothetical protein Lal_00018423 [Lupinus albus]
MFNTNQLTSSEGFTKALLVTVTEYQTRFERLSNEVVGLTPEIVLNCFLSGLNPEIARELTIQHHFSVTHAIGLAKLVESKITTAKTTNWHPTCPNMIISNNHNIGDSVTPTQQQIATSLPIKQLTATQIQFCRAQGLCYNCDEEYIAGHRCKSK